MSSKVTRENMNVRKGAKAISASERPVEFGKLGAYGSPAYSVTHDGAGSGEKGWSHIWLRFSEVTPDLESHLQGSGWELAKRGAWGYTNNAQGQAFVQLLTSGKTSPKGKADKSPTQAPKATPKEAAATPTQAPVTPPVKDTSNGKRTPEERVKAYTQEELISQLEYYATMAHLCAQELRLRK